MRVASGPDPPGSSRCVFERRRRRFLAYAFPPRSPHPRRPAVPARHGFVRAAPTCPGTSRGRLPSASQSCCDRTTVQVSHLYSINKRLTAHRRNDASLRLLVSRLSGSTNTDLNVSWSSSGAPGDEPKKSHRRADKSAAIRDHHPGERPVFVCASGLDVDRAVCPRAPQCRPGRAASGSLRRLKRVSM